MSCGSPPGRKNFPWKNPPWWSPLYRKRQRSPTSATSKPTPVALRADVDNVEPTLTASEPPPEDARVLIAQLGYWSEIPETPTVTPNNIRGGKDDHIDDGSGPFHFRCYQSTETDKLLGEDENNGET